MSDEIIKCPNHPDYKPIIPPTEGCDICTGIYTEAIKKLDEFRYRHPHNHDDHYHIRLEKYYQDYLDSIRWMDEGGN